MLRWSSSRLQRLTARRRNCLYRGNGSNIDFGADVETDLHEQYIRYLGQSMWTFSSTTWVSKHAVAVEGGQAVLGILQTVTSAVRIDVTLNDGFL